MEASDVLLIVIGALGAFFVLFIGIWLLITGLFRVKARMVRELDVDTGRFFRESSWDSGSVNGVTARKCLRVAEYQRCWIITSRADFGNGKFWLPRHEVRGGDAWKGNTFRPRYRTILCANDRVRLTGDLADFVEQSLPGDDGATEG